MIVDPLAVVPAFLAMTPNDTAEQRIRTARMACCVTAGVLLLFSVAGQLVFKVMSITMPAFQIAASILLLMVALTGNLNSNPSRIHAVENRSRIP